MTALGSLLLQHRSGFWGAEAGTGDVDVRVVRNGDIQSSGQVRWERLPIRGFARSELESSRVRAGDLLLTTSGNCGHVALVREDPISATCATNFIRLLRPDREVVDPIYLFYYMNRAPFRASLEPFIRGTAMKNLSVKDLLARSDVPLPSLVEQRRIAEVLDRADALRVKRRESLVVLEDLMKALFIDMFGDPAVNHRDWPVVELAQIAEQVTDGEHQTPIRSPTGVKLLSARNVRQGKLDFGDVDHVPHAEYERIRRRCDPLRGDILISCSGTIGRVALVNVDEPLALVRSVALVRPKRADVTADYLAYYLRSAVMQRRMNSMARASSQANLFQGPIRGLPVLLPPLRLQRLFSDSVERMMMTQDQLGSHGSMIESLFISLQQRAFSGQL